MLALLDIAIMTILDSCHVSGHVSGLSSARRPQASLGRIRRRAIAALPLLAFIGVAGAVLFLRIWFYLPPLPR